MSRDRAQLPPCELAQEILKVVGDADDSTARIALKIADLLLMHRKDAEIDFIRDATSDC